MDPRLLPQRVLRRGAALVVAGLLATSSTSAFGAGSNIDLRSFQGSSYVGAHKVSAAGDVNGDGLADLLVTEGSLWDDQVETLGGPRPSAGYVYVVFGHSATTTADLDASQWEGYLIKGARPGDYASEAVGVGDVNGDGLDDVVVGAMGADNNKRSSSGSAYVVFGKRDTDPVHLADLNLPLEDPRGFRIDGPSELALAGADVAGIDDLNDDGLDEVVVGAPFAGATYVVFGKRSSEPVDLLLFELDLHDGQGFVIDTPVPDGSSQYSVASAGDINSDGVSDLIIGVIRNVKRAGRAFVVFGSSSTERVDVRELGPGGFVITGKPGDGLGYSVAGIGDADGDGLDDVAVGAPSFDLTPDRAYVIFGRRTSTPVSVTDLGARGFKIRAKWLRDQTGASVAAAGDLNLDGLADLILGAERSHNRDRKLSGSAYVVYGKRSSTTVRLRYLRQRGFRIDGQKGAQSDCGREFCLGDLAASSVAGLGDFNGDGRSDLAVGAIFGGRSDQGKAYVVFGR